jgi:hypothetical protein
MNSTKYKFLLTLNRPHSMTLLIKMSVVSKNRLASYIVFCFYLLMYSCSEMSLLWNRLL